MRLDAVTVTVHNLTGHAVTPHFLVVVAARTPRGLGPGGLRGPLVLGAGATGTVTLRPDEFTWSPVHGAHWLVEAYTTSPDALSTSALQVWALGHQQ